MSLVRLQARSLRIIRSITQSVKCAPYSHRYLLFYKTKRYFSNKNIEEIVVPNLGDSITEGTVTAIHKQIGEQVATDDVVLEIETDKVSVDIRAPKNGFIATYFANVDQDVEVGGALYSISQEPLEGVDPKSIKPSQTSQPSQPSVSSTPTKPSSAPSPPPPQTTQTSSDKRVPSIKFRYGYNGDAVDTIVGGLTDISSSKSFEFGEETIQFWELPQNLRSPGLSDIDIEVINSGGAALFDSKPKKQKQK